MKKFLTLAVALVMTCAIAFAATQSPYTKAKEYGKKLLTLAISEDEEGLEELGESLENFVSNNIETEEDLTNFISGLEAGMREGCKQLGLSDEETDEVIEMMGAGMMEALLEAGM